MKSMGERESGPEHQAAGARAAPDGGRGEPGELRARLAAAESLLREQAAELSRLRHDVQQLRHLTLLAERPQPAASRRPARRVELPGLDALSTRESWLHRCEGFRVEFPNGTVGTVEEVRYGSRADRPDRLALRVGRWRSQLLLVPVEEVDEISPEEQLVLLSHDPDNISDQPATLDHPSATSPKIVVALRRVADILGPTHRKPLG